MGGYSGGGGKVLGSSALLVSEQVFYQLFFSLLS